MQIALYESEKNPHATQKEVTWHELTDMLRLPERRDTKYGRAWSPVELSTPVRRNENVLRVTAAVLDLDHLTEEQLEDAARRLDKFNYIAHSTYSDSQGNRCLRVIIKLSRAVSASAWPRFHRQLVSRLGVPADPACKDVARLYFLPARPEGAEYFFAEGNGGDIDVDEILMLADRPLPENVSPTEQHPSTIISDMRTLQQAMEWLANHGPAVEGQNGDLHTYIAAAALTHDFALSPEEAWVLLRAWNRTCHPPWDEAELLKKAQNAEQYATEPYGSRKPVIEQPEAYGRVLGEFVGDEEPPAERVWLLPGIIAAGVPQVIAGPPKAMKSYLATHMALALAAQKPWLHGDFTPDRRCKSLLLLHEDPANETKRRLWWLARGMGLAWEAISDYIYIDTDSSFHFDDTTEVERLQSTIEQLKPDLVIVDSLTESHHQDENSAAGMKPVIDTWAQLSRRNNVAIACIHHFRKPSEGFSNRTAGSLLRGSSAIHARVRHIVGIEPKGMEKGVSSIRIEGNLPGLPDSFLVRLQESVDVIGRPCYRMTFGGWQ